MLAKRVIVYSDEFHKLKAEGWMPGGIGEHIDAFRVDDSIHEFSCWMTKEEEMEIKAVLSCFTTKEEKMKTAHFTRLPRRVVGCLHIHYADSEAFFTAIGNSGDWRQIHLVSGWAFHWYKLAVFCLQMAVKQDIGRRCVKRNSAERGALWRARLMLRLATRRDKMSDARQAFHSRSRG
jgi:hypothetical protein